jgi:hypothetical protein
VFRARILRARRGTNELAGIREDARYLAPAPGVVAFRPDFQNLGFTAAAVNELSAARRRPALTENQVRAMIGGGAKKPVERAFGAVGDSRTKTACCFSTMEMSWYYFCKV